MENEIVLKSTGAIGDAVIASALVPRLNTQGYDVGLISDPHTLSLWEGIPRTRTYPQDPFNGNPIYDLSGYLNNRPHSTNLPSDFSTDHERPGHLSEWMAYELLLQSETIHVTPSRNNVQIRLTEEEVRMGNSIIQKISGAYRNKPVVIFAPYSTTKNRNIPKSSLEEIASGISSFAVSCLLQPFSETQSVETMISIGDNNLRLASAIIAASHAYVGVDSGPLHMINAVLQGTDPNLLDELDYARKDKIIALFGSSHPDVVGYEGNRIITGSRKECGLELPCGLHGYTSDSRAWNGKSTFSTSSDRSLCILSQYPESETSSCMASIDPEEVIETLKIILDEL